MRPIRSYLVCSTPRSGGGLLAGLLRSTGVVGRPEEYFWRDDVPGWRRRWGLSATDYYASRVLEEATTPNGVFGARVMWSYVEEAIEHLAPRTDRPRPLHETFAEVLPDLHYICLTRKDRVAQAVSWWKAIQTNEWFSGDERGQHRAPTFDRETIRTLLDEIVAGERGWERFFGGGAIEPLRLTYEEIAAQPENTAREVLSFLGIPVQDVRFEVGTKRQSDATNERWIEWFSSDTE